MKKDIPVYKVVLKEGTEKKGVYTIGIVDEPAIMVDAFKLKTDNPKLEFQFKADVEKQMMYGPILIPDIPILRYDKFGQAYAITFSAEVIDVIVSKYKSEKISKFNFNHIKEHPVEALLLEDWRTSKQDKSFEFGFDLPEKTWFGGLKVEDKQFWIDYVKTDKANGFSVEIEIDGLEFDKMVEMELSKVNKKEEENMEVNKLMLSTFKLEAQTTDGKDVKWDGDGAIGDQFYVKDENGEWVNAPEGNYEITVDETPVLVTVDAEGKIAEIQWIEMTEETETEVETETKMAVEPTEVMAIVQPIMDEFRAILADLTTRIEVLEAANAEEPAEDEATTEMKAELEAVKIKLSQILDLPGGSSINETKKLDKREADLLNKVMFFRNLNSNKNKK